MTKIVPAVSEEVKDSLVKNIKRRMTPQPLKIRADIEMKCFQFDGVLHIKVLFISVPLFLDKRSSFSFKHLICYFDMLLPITYLPQYSQVL